METGNYDDKAAFSGDTYCLTLLGEVDTRLRDARKRFDELADSRTGDPQLQAQIADQLLRWYVHGRSGNEPPADSAAAGPEDSDEAA